MSITQSDELSPFEAARRQPLMALWRPGATYVLVRWEGQLACGRLLETADGTRVDLRGRTLPRVGAFLEVRVPKITDRRPRSQRWVVTETERSADPELGAGTVWLAQL